MSYDVDVADEDFNYTWNLSLFFRNYDAYPGDWDGRNAAEVSRRP